MTTGNCSGGNFRLFIINIRSVAFFSMAFLLWKEINSHWSRITRFTLSPINLFNFTTFRVTRRVKKFLIGSCSGQKACGDHISTASTSYRVRQKPETGFNESQLFLLIMTHAVDECKCSSRSICEKKKRDY